MRDVVRHSGVALGTLYRHFSGRDHLIAELQTQWLSSLSVDRLRKLSDPADRVAELIHQTFTLLARSPEVARATVLAMQSTDDAVQRCQLRMDEQFMLFFSELVSDQPFSPASIVDPLRLAWHGALSLWAQDNASLEDLDDLLQDIARTVVAGAIARRTADPSVPR